MGGFKYDVTELVEGILDVLPFRWTWISGVEVTQSIQHFGAAHHLTDPAHQGSDNSVRLVAGKPSWVRVYAQSRPERRVTASLEVERRAFGFLWFPVGSFAPRPPGTLLASTTESYAQERGSIAETINFVIPAANFHGTLRLTVVLSDAASGTEYHRKQVVINAALRQTLRVRAIPVSYNGPSTSVATTPPPTTLNLPAPTVANLQVTAASAMLMMPVQSTGWFSMMNALPWTLPLDDPRSSAGGCSPNWDALLVQLGSRRTSDGNRADVVYYGILPTGIPINVPGCGVGGLGAGRVGDQATFVHEIGHGYDFMHTPCGNVGTSDPNYPNYQPYPSASIGEYGLNISNGQVFSPATTFDYMSYCPPQWMSLYQHGRLIHHPRLDPEFVGDEPLWVDKLEFREYVVQEDLPRPPEPWKQVEMRLNPVIALSGVVRSARDVDVVSVARVDAMGSPPGRETGLQAELVDEKGQVLASGAVRRLHTHGGCGCGDEGVEGYPYVFEAYVPAVARGALLRITDGVEEIWARRGSQKPPRAPKVEATVDRRGQLKIAWPEPSQEVTEAWLQWSDDKGATWHALATGLTEREATIDLAGVPAGAVQVRALLHDGFDTAVSRPVSVKVPDRPTSVEILSPREGEMLVTGGVLRLWGSAVRQDGSPSEERPVRWLLDRREVGTGLDVWLDVPDPGTHRVELVVGESRARVEFRSVDPQADFGADTTDDPTG
jgi:hypothetical protein